VNPVMPEMTWVPRASEIAREAGSRLREFFAQGVETEYKGDADLVTVADRTSEKLIRERLARAGFDVSEARAGRKPGTRVFTLRSGLIGAPALVIGGQSPDD